MLLFTVAACLLLAPALQGIWDFRTHFLFLSVILLSGGAWIFRESLAGRRPAVLSDRSNLPLLSAVLCALVAALLSPVRALVMREWWTFAAGAFVLALSASLDGQGRRRADLALRVSAWFIALLALYQAFALKEPNVSASLNNPNSLAMFTLMLLPAAAGWRDYFLFGALSAVMIATGSNAALLSLAAAAGFYFTDDLRRAGGRKKFLLLAAAAAVAAAALFGFDIHSAADRLGWWAAALGMTADRPFLGFGAGSFAYVYPAYHSVQPGGVGTVYAHNYYLEFLAENGLFTFFFWAWAAAVRFRRLKGFERYAVIAALVHSLADFGLAVPGNFFVFCYLLGGSGPPAHGAGTWSPPPALLWTAAAAALGCFAALCGVFYVQLELESLRGKAAAAVHAGDLGAAERVMEKAAVLAPGNPAAGVLLGGIRMRAGLEKKDRRKLFEAAGEFERALVLNPYDSGTYSLLEKLYGAVGEEELRKDLLRRKSRVFRRPKGRTWLE